MLAGSAATAAQASAAPAAPAAKTHAAAAPKADFNGDGYADTVSGAPTATVAGKAKAGYLTISYGSAKGASTTHRQLFSANSAGVPGEPGEGEYFGRETAARDFDGDGTTDLAVASHSGVTILWGAKDKGLTTGSAVADTESAHTLAAGDFNGDGKADLAVNGVSGDVRVLYGAFGKDGKPAQRQTLQPTGEDGASLDGLVAGDITGDGIDDLVTRHSFEEMARGSKFFKGSKEGLPAEPTKGVDAAASGVIADVDKDGYGDLVIRTVPGGVVEDLPYDHGTVKVLYGSAQGPDTGRTTTLTQNSAGVPGANEDGDEFGKALAAGDVNGDGYADIAVGVPGEDIGSGAAGKNSGAVVQLLGGKGGLSGTGAKNWDQGVAGVPGAVEAEDLFGSAVALGDTDKDGRDDLAIGAPGEDGDASATDAGAVWVLRGDAGGTTTDGVVSYGPKALGAPEKNAGLGSSFAH
nr:FG-GAP and VCBS repeat-containing protein [Streptomyces albus]